MPHPCLNCSQQSRQPYASSYKDLQLYYKWDVKNNMWKRRLHKIKVFGRINMVPIGTKVFYLRLLLTHVEAPTSFEDLLCYNDIVHPTYKLLVLQENFYRMILNGKIVCKRQLSLRCLNKFGGCLQLFLCLDNR